MKPRKKIFSERMDGQSISIWLRFALALLPFGVLFGLTEYQRQKG